jgi:hypothetical protein
VRVVQAASTENLSAVRARFEEARVRAEGRKREIDEEIRHYPTPIPRCDAQFNRLFAERDNLAALVERAKEFPAEAPAYRVEEWIEQFERALESAR